MIHTTHITHEQHRNEFVDLALTINIRSDKEIISFDILNKKTNKLMTSADVGGTSYSELLRLAYENALELQHQITQAKQGL